jgi:hypothetical protein
MKPDNHRLGLFSGTCTLCTSLLAAWMIVMFPSASLEGKFSKVIEHRELNSDLRKELFVICILEFESPLPCSTSDVSLLSPSLPRNTIHIFLKPSARSANELLFKPFSLKIRQRMSQLRRINPAVPHMTPIISECSNELFGRGIYFCLVIKKRALK